MPLPCCESAAASCLRVVTTCARFPRLYTRANVRDSMRGGPAPCRMVPPLEIRLLGPFEVLVGGRPANVSGAKRQCLLALLALHGGRVVGVDSLVDAVWGDDLPAAPRSSPAP